MKSGVQLGSSMQILESKKESFSFKPPHQVRKEERINSTVWLLDFHGYTYTQALLNSQVCLMLAHSELLFSRAKETLGSRVGS